MDRVYTTACVNRAGVCKHYQGNLSTGEGGGRKRLSSDLEIVGRVVVAGPEGFDPG